MYRCEYRQRAHVCVCGVHVPVRMSWTSSSWCTPTAKQPLAPKSVPLLPPKCCVANDSTHAMFLLLYACGNRFHACHANVMQMSCKRHVSISLSISCCYFFIHVCISLCTSCSYFAIFQTEHVCMENSWFQEPHVLQCLAVCCSVQTTYQSGDKTTWRERRTRLVHLCSLIHHSFHTYQSSCSIDVTHKCESCDICVTLECLHDTHVCVYVCVSLSLLLVCVYVCVSLSLCYLWVAWYAWARRVVAHQLSNHDTHMN